MTFAPALIFSCVTFVVAFWRYRNWRTRKLHPRFYDSISTGLIKFSVITAFICFVLALVSQLMDFVVPSRPASNEDYVVFPFLLIVTSGFVFLLQWIIIVLSGVNFCVVLTYFQANSNGCFSYLVVPIFIAPLVAFLCALQFAFALGIPSVTHRATIGFDNQIFRIAYSQGSTEDFDAIEAVYILYECDSVGFMCRNIGGHNRQFTQNPAFLREPQSFFLVEDERLFAIIGDNRITVR